MKKNQTLLKIVLLAISIYHIALGIFAFISENAAVYLAESFFGMTLIATPQLSYFAKLLGIYAFIFGVIMLYVMRDPDKYKEIIKVTIILYALRVINRIVFAGLVQKAFQVSDFSMILEIFLLIFFGGALWALMPRKR